jgi:uncharacterized membrane protein
MGAGHDHGTSGPAPVGDRTRRVLAIAVIAAALIAAVVALLTWPSGDNENTFNLGADLYPGSVRAVEACPPEVVPPGAEDIECVSVRVEIDEGVDAGLLFELPPFFEPRTTFQPGDDLILARIDGENAPFRYAFSDRDRKGSLLLLAALFAIAVVLLGRFRGLSALAGLASSVLILGFYTLPALLEGQSALTVACVSAALIAVVALYTSHGFTAMTTVAVLGTLLALGLTVVLGVTFIGLAQLSGFATEESLFIEGVGDIDVRGLLLAGLVLGALGALDDVTVTQASVVFELRRASPRQPKKELFAAGMRVGRDHVASTVNTLFLAYAGAALPLLLLFSVGQLPAVDVANSEIVATEIVRTLVGSIGLVASVPITTWLAVAVVGYGDDGPIVEPGQRPPVRRSGPSVSTESPPAVDGPTSKKPAWSRLRDGIDD